MFVLQFLYCSAPHTGEIQEFNDGFEIAWQVIVEFYEFCRVHGYGSLSPQINLAWSEVAVLERLFLALPDMPEYKQELRNLTKRSNNVLFEIIEDTARAFAENVPNQWTKDLLDVECQRFQK